MDHVLLTRNMLNSQLIIRIMQVSLKNTLIKMKFNENQNIGIRKLDDNTLFSILFYKRRILPTPFLCVKS